MASQVRGSRIFPLSRPPARLGSSHKSEHRPPFDCIALLLQGGGALGAYQAGVYEALAEADLWPDCVAGTSIGGINSAIIAGNTREKRVAKLPSSGTRQSLSLRFRRRLRHLCWQEAVDRPD